MSGDVASPASMLMISGDALAQTFSPFAVGTPAPSAADEEGFTCSQVPCAGMGPQRSYCYSPSYVRFFYSSSVI